MKERSLLIVSVPRSGSTELQRICSSVLKFKDVGEFLNKGFRSSRVKFPQHGGAKYFPPMRAKCEKLKHNCVVRDVVQEVFVTYNIDWLSERFNIIYLYRPPAESKLCSKLVGWHVSSQKLRKRLESAISPSDHIAFFDYYDFIFGPPGKLHNVLKKWYPFVKKVNYLTPSFVLKRNATLKKIRRHGIKPKRLK